MTRSKGYRGYSDETAAKVKAAFDEIVARGDVVMISAIAQMIGMSVPPVRWVLQDMGYWTPDRIRAAKQEGSAHANAQFARDGFPNLKKAFATNAAHGFPNLQKSWANQAASGYPNIKKASAAQQAMGNPGARRSNEIQAMSGYQGLKKGARVSARRRRGKSLTPTHYIIRHGERKRYRVYATLLDWDDARDGRRSSRAIARVLGMTTVWENLHRLCADGLIDATNHVIAPWPDDATSAPTNETTTDDPRERAERE